MKKVLFFVLLVAVAFWGCAPVLINKTLVQYLDYEKFTFENLNTGGLAMFPVIGGPYQEGNKRFLGDSFDKYLEDSVPSGPVMKWETTAEYLNSKDAVESYQLLLNRYRETSIVDKTLSAELAEALGLRYGLMCQLVEVGEKDISVYIIVIDMKYGDIQQEIVSLVKQDDNSFGSRGTFDEYADNIVRGVLSTLPGSHVPRP